MALRCFRYLALGLRLIRVVILEGSSLYGSSNSSSVTLAKYIHSISSPVEPAKKAQGHCLALAIYLQGAFLRAQAKPVPALHSAAEAAELTFLAGHFTNMKNGAVSLTTFFISCKMEATQIGSFLFC